MEVNMSEKTIATAANALRDARTQARSQMRKYQDRDTAEKDRKYLIAEYQLEEIEDALAVFEEIEDMLIGGKK